MKKACAGAQRSRKGKWAVLAVILGLVAAWAFMPGRVPALPVGEWQAKDGRYWMKTDDQTAAIGRKDDKSSFVKLPNREHRGRIYAIDDLAKAHPQRLRMLKDGSVEWLREASGGSPEYRAVFVRKGGGR